MTVWLPVLLASAGCYALKFAGLAAPQRLLDRPAVRKVVELIPLALLAALIAVQTFATGQRLVLDARAAGLVAAAVAVLLRAPFVVVVVVAALAAALVRLV
jgi:branched chain amino acid efflux pump